MHQQPPKMPLLRSTNAANAAHVDSSRALTVYAGATMKPSLPGGMLRCRCASAQKYPLTVSLYGRDGVRKTASTLLNSWRAVVDAAVVDRRCVPALDADGVRRPERDVRARRDAISTWLCSDRVKREVVTRTAPEQDVCVAFELTLA